MNPARYLFTVSLIIGFFWLLGFAIEGFVEQAPSIWVLIIGSIITSIATSWLIYYHCPKFLIKHEDSEVSLLKYYLISILCSYFLLVPLFAMVAYILVRIFGDIHHHEAGIFIALLAIWFPIWWIIPVGLSIGWLVYERKYLSISQRSVKA